MFLIENGYDAEFTRTLDEYSADKFTQTMIGEMAGKSKYVPANSTYEGESISREDLKLFHDTVRRLK